MSFFHKLKKLFLQEPKKLSTVDQAVKHLSVVSNLDWSTVYSSDFKNNTLVSYYKDIGVYCKALKYILQCFENHKAISVYYVNSEPREMYLSEWFLSEGNLLDDVNFSVNEFLSMASSFLEQYQEMEDSASFSEQLTVERNLQLTRTLVSDLVNLAGQFQQIAR